MVLLRPSVSSLCTRGAAVALKTSACDALDPITLEKVRDGLSMPPFCLHDHSCRTW